MRFFVPGLPAPGGSKKTFIPHRKGETPGEAIARGQRIVVVDMGGKRNKDWRSIVALVASEAMAGRPILLGPLRLDITFILPRPQFHYRTGKYAGDLKPWAPSWPTTRPDKGKLERSTTDAMTKIVWHDDAQIVAGEVKKIYGHPTGAEILVFRMMSGLFRPPQFILQETFSLSPK